jgi:hypothetical protein
MGDGTAYSAHECHFHAQCIMWRVSPVLGPDVPANLRITLCSTLHVERDNR